MTSSQLAAAIRYFRKQSGLSQQQLAELAGVGKTAVYDLEKAKETVQLNTLLKILNILNIQLEIKTPMPFEENKA